MITHVSITVFLVGLALANAAYHCVTTEFPGTNLDSGWPKQAQLPVDTANSKEECQKECWDYNELYASQGWPCKSANYIEKAGKCEMILDVASNERPLKRNESSHYMIIHQCSKDGASIQQQTCPKLNQFTDRMPCDQVIKKLAECDKCLDTRSEVKWAIARMFDTAQEFVQYVKGKECWGQAYNCGRTRGYVTELFEGLERQLDEYKYYKQEDSAMHKQAGYEMYTTKESMAQIFVDKLDSQNTVIYHLQHWGKHDHDWAIEQLPGGQGYRIYQSYHDAYSLLAWMSPPGHDQYETLFQTGQIMLPEELQREMDAGIKKLVPEASWQNPALVKGKTHLDKMLDFVSTYDKEKVFKNFEISHKQFGGWKVLTQNEFLYNYLNKTGYLLDYLASLKENSSEAYDKEMYNLWTELYASPDPQFYPGIPYKLNVGVDMKNKGKPYRFYMKAVEIPETPKCVENARIMIGQ